MTHNVLLLVLRVFHAGIFYFGVSRFAHAHLHVGFKGLVRGDDRVPFPGLPPMFRHASVSIQADAILCEILCRSSDEWAADRNEDVKKTLRHWKECRKPEPNRSGLSLGHWPIPQKQRAPTLSL
jgi:hypothetical protein